MSATAQSESRAQMLLEQNEIIRGNWDALLAGIKDREPTSEEQGQITMYREKFVANEAEAKQLTEDIELTKKSIENATNLRRLMARSDGAVTEDENGIVYSDFAAYARDAILTRTSGECAKIAAQVGGDAVLHARERLDMLKARVNNTLSSNVGGLIPQQHIAQIFQVIDNSRPIVASAVKATLERGTLSYPKITTPPVVAVQASEKTAAGDTGMVIDMLTSTASTYLGAGDLSWQAINWSTPSALDLWFQLCAADYALKTEQDAAVEIGHSAHFHPISTRFGATGTFAEFMTAVGAGAAVIYAASKRMANTVYMAPDRYWYIFGLTSTATAQFTNVATGSVGPMTFVPSRGLDSGEIIVGDSSGLLVAETAGAPVELRVVEPAIGGLEVGIIGAFEAVVVDDGAFSLITAAS